MGAPGSQQKRLSDAPGPRQQVPDWSGRRLTSTARNLYFILEPIVGAPWLFFFTFPHEVLLSLPRPRNKDCSRAVLFLDPEQRLNNTKRRTSPDLSETSPATYEAEANIPSNLQPCP